MASNVTLNDGTGTVKAVTAQVTHDGDTAQIQGVFLMGISGTEDAYTAGKIGGDATNGLDVDVTRSALPSGASTSAKQDTAQTTLDTIASAIKAEDLASANADPLMIVGAVRRDAAAVGSVTDGDYSTLNVNNVGRLWTTAVLDTALPAGTNNIGDVDVLTLPALAAGTNNIGDVDVLTIAAGDNNIGNVDIVTMPNVTLAAGTNTNEVVGDAAHDAAASGNPVLLGAYASAAAPSDVSADADVVRLWALRNGSPVVNIAAGGSLIGATSNALDVNIKSGAGSGGTAMADDAAFTPATTSFTPVGGIVTSDSVDSGDGGAFAMLANRQQKVTLYDSGGVELAVGGGTQYTEDAAAAGNPVGNALILVREDARAGSLTTTDGDNVAARGNNKGELYVKHTDAIDVNSHAVTNAGTFPVQATLAAGATSIGKAEDVASVDADVGVPAMAVRKATPANTSGTDGDYEFLQMSVGRLWTSSTIDAALPAGTNNIGDVDVLTVPADPFGANADAASATGSISAKLRFIASTGIPVTGTVTVNNTAQASTNTQEIVGDVAQDAAAAGNPVLVGVRASTAIPTAMSADGDSVFAWADLNGAVVVAGRIVDDAAFTVATSRVHPIGLMADESSTDSVDEGDAGIPRMTLDRKTIITPYVHAAAGGWLPHKNLDCDESEDDIKTSPGKLGWIHVINRSTGVRYIKFYNATAANTTVGSTTPVLSFPIPTMADTNGAGFTISFGDAGVFFDTAICVAATTGVADADTGAPGTNDVVLNAGYV